MSGWLPAPAVRARRAASRQSVATTDLCRPDRSARLHATAARFSRPPACRVAAADSRGPQRMLRGPLRPMRPTVVAPTSLGVLALQRDADLVAFGQRVRRIEH